jgi:hypothetical protein
LHGALSIQRHTPGTEFVLSFPVGKH